MEGTGQIADRAPESAPGHPAGPPRVVAGRGRDYVDTAAPQERPGPPQVIHHVVLEVARHKHAANLDALGGLNGKPAAAGEADDIFIVRGLTIGSAAPHSE